MFAINPFELLNVFIAVILLVLLVRHKEEAMPILILIVYGTLHFSSATLSLLSNNPSSLLRLLHQEGGGFLAKVSALFLLSGTFIALSTRAYCAASKNQGIRKDVSRLLIFPMIVIFSGYLLNIRLEDPLQLKNVVSIEAMFIFLLVGFMSIENNLIKLGRRIIVGIVIMAAMIDIIALYEVTTHQSWSVFTQSSGEKVFRAASLLFNPNLLGLWAGLIYLGLSHQIQCHHESRGILAFGMFLTAIAIYLSGSRSALYILLVSLFIIPFLANKCRLKWMPLTLLISSELILYLGSIWLSTVPAPENVDWNSLALLGKRLSEMPMYLAEYSAMKVTQLLNTDPASIAASVPIEFSTSIEGRFYGTKSDSGWLVLFQDTGWLGIGALLLTGVRLAIIGIRSVILERSTDTAFAVAILIYIALIGFTLRIQIFPIWLFLSMALIPCFVIWFRPMTHTKLPKPEIMLDNGQQGSCS